MQIHKNRNQPLIIQILTTAPPFSRIFHPVDGLNLLFKYEKKNENKNVNKMGLRENKEFPIPLPFKLLYLQGQPIGELRLNLNLSNLGFNIKIKRVCFYYENYIRAVG